MSILSKKEIEGICKLAKDGLAFVSPGLKGREEDLVFSIDPDVLPKDTIKGYLKIEFNNLIADFIFKEKHGPMIFDIYINPSSIGRECVKWEVREKRKEPYHISFEIKKNKEQITVMLGVITNRTLFERISDLFIPEETKLIAVPSTPPAPFQPWEHLKELIAEKANDFMVSLQASSPQFAYRAKDAERDSRLITEVTLSTYQWIELTFEKRAGYRMLVIMEDGEKKRKVVYPVMHSDSQTQVVNMDEEGESLTLRIDISGEEMKIGDYTFYSFLYTGLDDDQMKSDHHRFIEERLRQITEEADEVLSSVRVCRIVG